MYLLIVIFRTYKCGHCGKTHLDNSEFHRHSALSHGDKIPDLVKDPEVKLINQSWNFALSKMYIHVHDF